MSSFSASARTIPLTSDEGQIVLSLYREGPMSRTDLARRLDCSRAKAGQLVNALIARDILEELNEDSTGRSRQLGINHRLGYVAGVDIGTTSIDVGLADLTGRLQRQAGQPSNVDKGPEVAAHFIEEQVDAMLTAQGASREQLYAIGIGVPGPVRFPEGYIVGRHFLPGWDGYGLRQRLQEAFPLAVVILDNDANVMALGEQRRGLGREVEDFIFVKVGTGIGAGVISGGKLLRGATSCAGHIGHTCVDFNGPVCRCGNRGCLEAVAAGPAIAAAAMEAAQEQESAILARLLAEQGGVLSAKDVGEAATKGDAASLYILQESGRNIGDVLAGVVNLMNPELIVVGGGVSKSGYQLLTEIRRAILNRSYPYTTMELRVEYSPLVDEVGLHGCVTLALDWLYRVEGESLESLG